MRSRSWFPLCPWRSLIFFLVIAWVPPVAFAQSYPAKPVRVVVGFPPGSGADISARIIAAKVSEPLITWFRFVAPAKTPQAVVSRLNSEIVRQANIAPVD